MDEVIEEPGAAARARSKDWVRAVPSSNQKIGPVICKGGREVWRDPEGRLRVCTIAHAVTLHGLDIAAGAYTHFHADGSPHQTTLARPLQLKTARGLAIDCAAEHVSLSARGKLTYCELQKQTIINQIVCRAGEGIGFYDDGRLYRAVIDAPVNALGVTFAAGMSLSWHPGAQLKGAWLREKMQVTGYLIRFEFEAYPSGALRSFELAEPRTLASHAFPAGAKIILRHNGSIQRGQYISDEGFLPHGEQWHDTLYLQFDCSGKQISAHTEHWQAPTGSGLRKP